MDNKSTKLSDGRKLGYAEYGGLQGWPLFFFHGQPGNRLFCYPDNMLTSSLDVRLICMGRPGYGLSDFQPGWQLIDWPGDICQLADFLNIERFSILGFSAGGPYALVCAKHIPYRLTRVGIADSAPPMYLREINKISPGILRIH